MIRNYINWIIKYKKAIALLVPIIVFVLASFLKDLQFEGSYRIWFGEESKILKGYDGFRKVFGNDDGVVVAFKDENGVFNEKALSSIRRITDKLWETKYVARVDSLTNYQYVYADKEYPDEIIVEDLVLDDIKYTDKNMQELKSIALNDPDIVDGLISKDGTTTLIVARLIANAGENEDISMEFRDYILDIVSEEKELTGYEYHLTGGAIITTAFVDIAMTDGSLFTTLTIGMVVILLLVLFRKISGMALPMSVVVFTFLSVLAIQVVMGYKLNNFTANMPVFVTAIGIAHAVHIYWIWMVARRAGSDNEEAIFISLEKNFKPVFLTSLTTAIGFASLSISHVVPVKTLGIATASAAVLAFVLSVVYIPAVLAWLNPKVKKDDSYEETSIEITPKYARKYSEFIVSYDKYIVVFALVSIVGFGFGLTKVVVDSNTIKYFNEKEPVRQSIQFIQDNLSGPMSLEIVVDSKEVGGAKDPVFMSHVDRFSKEYYEEFGEVRKVGSLVNIVKRFNRVMNGDNEEYYSVPDTKELISQYILLYSFSLPQGMEINDKIDIEDRYLRVTSSVDMSDTSKYLEMIYWAEDWWKNTPYTATVHGQTAMFAHMQKDVTDTLIYSMSIALGLITLIMLIVFKSLKWIVVFLLPNVLPIVLVLGIMGWVGIDIDMGMAVAGAIILGVAVDDTIHFVMKYKDARNSGKGLKESLEYVLTFAGGAMIFTTIILSLAFLILLGSSFNPNVNFAIVTASALTIALSTDLLLLPALFSIIDRKRRVD